MRAVKGAGVVAVWGLFNALLVVMLVAFGGPSLGQRFALFAAATAITLTAAAVLLVVRPRPGRGSPDPPPAASGAPSVALAAAFLIGGLAWIFGVYLAYLSAPLLVYAAGKWRAERTPGGPS